MNRFVSSARLLARAANKAQGPVGARAIFAVAPRAVPQQQVLLRSFGAGASAGHGAKDEPFLDTKVVAERIISVVKNFDKVSSAKVTATARFKEDLDLDSLDAVEVVMAIEEEFGIEIPDSEADKLLSVGDVSFDIFDSFFWGDWDYDREHLGCGQKRAFV